MVEKSKKKLIKKTVKRNRKNDNAREVVRRQQKLYRLYRSAKLKSTEKTDNTW